MSNRDSFILDLMRKKGMTLAEAEEFASDLDIPEGPSTQQQAGAWRAGDSVLVREGNDRVAARNIVAQRGSDGLTASQAEGIARGAVLCQNCQQPSDAHLPGCFRDPRNGFREDETRRAVTRPPLAPAT